MIQKIDIKTTETGKNKMFEIILFANSSNFGSKDTNYNIGKIMTYNH